MLRYAILYYTLLYFTIRYDTIWCCTLLYSTLLYSTLLYSTLLYTICYTIYYAIHCHSVPYYNIPYKIRGVHTRGPLDLLWNKEACSARWRKSMLGCLGCVQGSNMEVSKRLGVRLRSPYSKDQNMLLSILRPAIVGNSHIKAEKITTIS